ncbi:MAG: 30S ribosomal protein S1 [Gammaproteobacteria bacterium]
MSESFAELFAQEFTEKQLYSGKVVQGEVIKLMKDFVLVNVGLKTEGFIPIDQFFNDAGELEIELGSTVDVYVETPEDGTGETRLSREKAKRAESWVSLEQAHNNHQTVRGYVSGRVKGGFTVELGGIRAFLPGSLIDVRSSRETPQLEGRELDFKVIKLDRKTNNVVVSRRSMGDGENVAERDELLSKLHEGQVVMGVVKNLTDYGAFVDLGGIDGLLHITDISWKRVKHPSEVLTVGQEIEVRVLKFDRERNRVSLGLKQMGEDPWLALTRRYPIGTHLTGRVTNVTDYGCFVEIDQGVEGLVHVSEMDWTNKNIHPSKVVQLDQEVQVMVLDIDEERRRISLGIKQCVANPWEAFAATQNKGDRVTGKIKSITDFGIFVGLEGNIDGLVHLSDISWDLPGEEAIRNYKKGQEIEAVVLVVDAERERISLGIKQLDEDNFTSFVNNTTKGTAIAGKIVELDEKGATIELNNGLPGYLKASENNGADLQVGQELEARYIGVDKKNRVINLSLKAKDESSSENETGNATLGDLLKEQMENKNA